MPQRFEMFAGFPSVVLAPDLNKPKPRTVKTTEAAIRASLEIREAMESGYVLDASEIEATNEKHGAPKLKVRNGAVIPVNSGTFTHRHGIPVRLIMVTDRRYLYTHPDHMPEDTDIDFRIDDEK